MKLLMKMADTSNVFKPFPMAKAWAVRVTDEFFRQGDLERQQGLPVTPHYDRSTQSRVALQERFIGFISTFHKGLAEVCGNMEEVSSQLDSNLAAWGDYDDEILISEEGSYPCYTRGPETTVNDGVESDKWAVPPLLAQMQMLRLQDGNNQPTQDA